MTIEIRRITAEDGGAYRDLRLEALRVSPASFGMAYEDSVAQDPAEFIKFIPAETDRNAIFGALLQNELVGMAGLHVYGGRKLQHKAMVWGVYVREAARGHGLGEALVTAVIERARTRVAVLQLTVGAHNAPARAIYERLGFVAYGLERRGLRVDGVDYDEILMSLDFENGL